VRRFAKPSDVRDCNILFLGRAETDHLAKPSQSGVLTVGESPAFLKEGGVINFYVEDNRVRFEIQPAVARAVGLRVSSQLLKLGRVL
jgi:hypothetical protein